MISKAYKCSVVRVKTTDGTMFVTIMEEDSKPIEIHISIGKTGSQLRAWSDALSHVINLAMFKGSTIQEIIEVLSLITSDKIVYDGRLPIRSGPEGLVVALRKYLKSKGDEAYNGPRFNLYGI